jgi:Holliday junction resolvase RusA-like endonuclease
VDFQSFLFAHLHALRAIPRKAKGLQLTVVRLVLLGEPASKANSRREAVNPRTGRRMVIKSEKALDYAQAALQQIPPACRRQLAGDVRVDMRIFYASLRPDLDESLILDILQDQFVRVGGQRVVSQRGVYCNDRQVKEKHIYHRLDKKNPRTEIQVIEL